ncbi:hypothetical protein BRADI_1g35653v3 [Brachypodium distachyon]|uniref:Uncharacterized protein n=1 Tax=Brachypodium distachyon TaxID=15368 RepID=A0A2K2DMW8_BRADI|nr:hypothetical protein BRADI_1g35653v3 [Brachypodium distachyon]
MATMCWWNRSIKIGKQKEKHKDVTVAVYTIWNIWKERNRRIFQNEAISKGVGTLIKNELSLQREARRE